MSTSNPSDLVLTDRSAGGIYSLTFHGSWRADFACLEDALTFIETRYIGFTMLLIGARGEPMIRVVL